MYKFFSVSFVFFVSFVATGCYEVSDLPISSIRAEALPLRGNELVIRPGVTLDVARASGNDVRYTLHGELDPLAPEITTGILRGRRITGDIFAIQLDDQSGTKLVLLVKVTNTGVTRQTVKPPDAVRRLALDLGLDFEGDADEGAVLGSPDRILTFLERHSRLTLVDVAP